MSLDKDFILNLTIKPILFNVIVQSIIILVSWWLYKQVFNTIVDIYLVTEIFKQSERFH